MLFVRVLFFILNLVLDFVFILIYPFFQLFSRTSVSAERLGLYPPKLDKPIWIHAASVGEVNAILPLLEELLKIKKDVLVTTTSFTGRKRVIESGLAVEAHLLPLDVHLVINSFIKRLKPSMLLIVETEIWPNLLLTAIKQKVPVGWVNARISERSLLVYKMFGFLLKPLFKQISFVNTQTGVDTRRFRKLGFKQVTTAGNLKFSINLHTPDPERTRTVFGIKSSDFVLVWGSSRPGEEAILASILPELEKQIENLKTVIVPRHLNRMEEVCKALGPRPFDLFSRGTSMNHNLLAVDEMGVLNQLYSIADIAIVGGSFEDFGGHNPLEPAFFGKAIIIGPYHQSCKGSVRALNRRKGIIISDKEQLLQDILSLYKNEHIRKAMGEGAKQTLAENSKAQELTITSIKKLLV
jgi:3-deoxy-D-manno-octulosonic-acid transferase